MDFFPVYVNLHDRPCLVVGGGVVAARKARALLAAGARVTVNAPFFGAALLALRTENRLRLVHGPFDPALLDSHLLVVAATSDAGVNRRVAEHARAALRLCNVVDDAGASGFIVPAVVDRSPLIVAVSSGGRAPVLARLIRQRLEQWLPVGLGRLAAWAGGWRERIRARLGASSRTEFWERLLAGPAGASVLAGDIARADAQAEQLAAGLASRPRAGHAWLVGAGPGDPGMITVRGLEVLQRADVILHDRLVAPALLRAARREAEIVCVGKAAGAAAASQADINRLLIEHVRAGRRVCRLKGGDPLVFGRGGEEAGALAAAGLPFEIVPGVTAASGCAAHAGIPLTHRGLAGTVTLTTAVRADGGTGPDWARLAADGHTLVVYMGGARVGAVAAGLVRHGRAAHTPAALVAHGTTAAQRVVTGTLADIAAKSATLRGLSPALLIVGETVALAGTLGWREAASGEAAGSPFLPLPAALAG
jgi:uroporphyrin-III C-methyltransferase/precorrin-2 dehydrogenase/sirohydrochlorin ferrochelatase